MSNSKSTTTTEDVNVETTDASAEVETESTLDTTSPEVEPAVESTDTDTETAPETEAEVVLPKGITPYAAARLVNQALLDAGVVKTLPPQMFYNYTTARVRKGQKPLINTIVVDGKILIDTLALAAWTQKYVRKQIKLAELLEEEMNELQVTVPDSTSETEAAQAK